MRHMFKGSLAVLAWFTFAISGAQMMAPNYTGSFTVDEQPYNGGPILWFSLARIAAGGMNPATSAVWLAPEPDTAGNTDGRTMMKFKADGSGNLNNATWRLPSTSDGSSTVAQKGEERVFSTWTPGWCIAPMNSHQFHSEVGVTGPGAEAWVDIDVQQAPKPFLLSTSGEFQHDFLDNSNYDRDAAEGLVRIDKFETPSVTLQFSLPSFTMRRNEVQWQDGGSTPSTFADKTYSSIWIIFEAENGQYVFRSASSDPVFFNPGEGAADKTIDALTGTMNFDISSLRTGNYKVHYLGVPWTADYVGDGGVSACASGFISLEHIEYNVQVVPEPASLLGLTFAGIPLLKRRLRRR